MAITLDSFLAAISGQESGGNYTARNPDSGAYGKYQIMPANWPSWAREAGLPANAPQTPENQERVVRHKVQQYYDKYGNWEDVAAVWYSGQPLGSNQHASQGNYPSIRSYVDSVVGRAGGSAGGSQMTQPTGGLDYNSARARLQELWTIGESDPRYFEAQEEIAGLVSILPTLWAAERESRGDSSDPNSIATADFQNKVQEAQLGIAFDNLSIGRATADLNRFLGGMELNTTRAQEIAAGKDMLRRWGTAPGKSSYTYGELGAGFEQAARTSGIDPGQALINYTGTTRIDPEADFRRLDAALGVNGPLPTIPGLTTDPANFPKAPTLDVAGILAGTDSATTTPATAGPGPQNPFTFGVGNDPSVSGVNLPSTLPLPKRNSVYQGGGGGGGGGGSSW